MIEFTTAINKGQLNDQGEGTFTVTIIDPNSGLRTYLKPNYTTSRPASVGDVYSADPNGGPMQGREPGANGPYERATISGTVVRWTPQGTAGAATIAPYGGN